MSDAMTDRPLQIDMLRHGLTEAGKCFLGATDAQLSRIGWQQMDAAPLDSQYDRVISSPLSRCCAFARKKTDGNADLLVINDDLREIHFGDWEGKTSQQIWNDDEAALSRFWRDPLKHPAPGGESFDDFQQRVLRAFDAITGTAQGQKILLVIHGGVIKLILAHCLGLSVERIHQLTIDHGGLSRIEIWPGQMPRLLFINRMTDD